jgi:hypothetical protein
MQRFLLAGLCLLSISLRGQQIQNDSVKTSILEEFVITATKQEESLLRAPVSIEKMNSRRWGSRHNPASSTRFKI